MSNRLPDKIRPLHLADTRQTLSGYFPLEKMSRLAPSLSIPQGIVEVELEFGIDEQKIRYAKGNLKTLLNLVCQRCFKSMPYTVNAGINLGMATSLDEADLLPESYEPLMLEESAISFLELIEDELILLLPLVISHKERECNVKQDFSSAPEQQQDIPVKKENPFAVLEQLKKTK